MKKWLKFGLVVLALVAASVGIYFGLRAAGITNVESLRALIAKCGAWGWIVFIALFILASTFLCFVPGTSATFIAVSILLFGAWKGFVISTVSVFLASSLMFLIGNTLGEQVAGKIVGEESLHKAQNLLDMKSKMLLPLMFVFPVFPDDALCMVAGMTKMKYWYFAVVALIFRTVGIATICFLGSGFINWAALSLVDWFVLINICVLDIFIIFKYQHKIEQFIMRKRATGMKKSKEKKAAKAKVLSDADKKALLIKRKKEVKTYCDRSQTRFKVGDHLYTIKASETVIDFYVDRIRKIFTNDGETITRYMCDWELHSLPKTKHGEKFRYRENHNLFATVEEAKNYLKFLNGGEDDETAKR